MVNNLFNYLPIKKKNLSNFVKDTNKTTTLANKTTNFKVHGTVQMGIVFVFHSSQLLIRDKTPPGLQGFEHRRTK